MTDTLSEKHRSWVMSRIRSGDTKPELIVRSLLHRSGYRYSLRRKDLPGNPDLVMPKYKAVVFIHGCFWHWHQDPSCNISKVPKSNTSFWLEKFKYNTSRDARNEKALKAAGWKVIQVWECEVLRDPESALIKVIRQLHGPADSGGKAVFADLDLKQVVGVAEARHRFILNKKTGSAKFNKDENTNTT
jgi:DNA mismatch endonuclease (patch repair protein)